jgi:hypothetical protein
MAAKKRYRIATQNGYIDGSFTKAEAHKVLAEVVKEDAQSCRRGKRSCSVVGSSRSGSVKIVIGGRQGYHLWQRYVITPDRS